MASLPETAESPLVTSPAGGATEKAGILLIDDDPAERLALRTVLDELDEHTVDAASAPEALELLAARSFAVVLLDTSRPALGGFDTARRIRAGESSRDTPIIFLSNSGIDQPTLEAGYALGDVDFLFKPILPIVLRAKVRGFLELLRRKRRSEREAAQLRAMLRSITETEDRLRRSEQRFARFMQQLPGLAWIKDREGRYVYVNDAAEKAFGTPRERLYGRTDDEVFPPETAAQFRANDRRAVEGLRGLQAIEQLTDEQGEVRHSLVSKFPIIEPDGRIALVGGMAIDITEQLRVQEEREKFALLVENSRDFIGMCDRDFMPFFVNREGLKIVGLESIDAAIRTPVAEFFFPEDRPFMLEEFFPRVLREGHGQVEIRFRHFGTGEPIWMTYSVITITDAAGERIGLATISRDIRRLKEVENQLRDADRRKDEFLATLAHELRNPLAPISSALEILKMPRVDPQIAEETRAVIERQFRHLVRLVDDLLDVSRVMRGKIELRREPVEAAAVIARAVETARPLIVVQGHRLELAVSGESLVVDADPVRLAQVVGNLLTNAAKYTEPGGMILLTAEREADEVVLEVHDSGIGIAPEMLPHVFELFVQAENAWSRAQGGLGIGLTLVKNLVELHGGTVTAASPGLGRGSRFTVRLPLLPAPPQERVPAGETAVTTAVPPTGYSILVVDDNADAAATLSMLLQLKGHDVRVAHDGRSALAMAAEFRPAVVFLDLGMPEIDGYETARRLRAIPGLEHAVLAALTGWGRQDDRRRTAEAGFDRHLVKPPEPKQIDDLLAELKTLRG